MPPTKHRTTRRIHTAAATEPPVVTPVATPAIDQVLEPASPENPPNATTTIHVSREDLIGSLRRSIEGAAPEMINAIIDQGKEGSYLHTKFLFEFAGLTAIPAGDASTEQSLAAVLLRALALETNLDSNHVVDHVATGVPPVVAGLQPSESGEKDNRASAPGNDQQPKADNRQQPAPLLSPAFADNVPKANGACKPASARP